MIQLGDAQLYHGDCFEVLKELEDDSIDTVITDPPAGISFMGRDWDGHSDYRPHNEKTGRVLEFLADLGLDAWERGFAAFTADWGIEVMRVMKPGATALVWALPRTSDLTGLGLRIAGFQIRDNIYHIFGSGFPKGHDISKAIDKEVRGYPHGGIDPASPMHGKYKTQASVGKRDDGDRGQQYGSGSQWTIDGQWTTDSEIVADAAKLWDGWNTAIKPSAEEWIVAQKPRQGTYAANALEHGVSGYWIDGARIKTSQADQEYITERIGGFNRIQSIGGKSAYSGGQVMDRSAAHDATKGRWPANTILSHSPACEFVGLEPVQSAGHYPAARGKGGVSTSGHKGQDDLEERYTAGELVELWDCDEDCPVRLLDQQSGRAGGAAPPGQTGSDSTKNTFGTYHGRSTVFHDDSGGASRFFMNLPPTRFRYISKPSPAEKNAGLGDLPAQMVGDGREKPIDNAYQRGKTERRNTHPTVKSIALLEYLCKLTRTPTGGIVLDLFMGSGSHGIGAFLARRPFIGIERNKEAFETAVKRIDYWQRKGLQLSLFGD
jgi:site-specific DNA-methyltransferase (adenine-specific)